jgi:hypothetical protein
MKHAQGNAGRRFLEMYRYRRWLTKAVTVEEKSGETSIYFGGDSHDEENA